jgi:hypothetical protein
LKDILLFLGSDPSAPFGLPTMKDLVKLLEEELLKLSNRSTSNDVIYAKKLLTIYRAFVRRKCQIKNSMDSKITQIYSDLFDKLGAKYKFQKINGKDGKEYLYTCYCSIFPTGLLNLVSKFEIIIYKMKNLQAIS